MFVRLTIVRRSPPPYFETEYEKRPRRSTDLVPRATPAYIGALTHQGNSGVLFLDLQDPLYIVVLVLADSTA
eukprot:7392342-Pyramimonas_sp.AAC.2